jgi:hypothetical protein
MNLEMIQFFKMQKSASSNSPKRGNLKVVRRRKKGEKMPRILEIYSDYV